MAAKKKWIKGAIKRPGAFRAKAKRAGRSTNAHARAVLKKGSKASTRTKRQAALALTLSKMRGKRRRSTSRKRSTAKRRSTKRRSTRRTTRKRR